MLLPLLLPIHHLLCWAIPCKEAVPHCHRPRQRATDRREEQASEAPPVASS